MGSTQWLYLLPALVFVSEVAGAAVPTSKLLPATTKAHIWVNDWARFADNWNRTQLARIFDDKGFTHVLDEMRAQGIDGLGLGIDWDDVRSVAGGEVSWGTIQPAAGQAAQVFLIDTSGKPDQTRTLMAKVAARLQKQGYQAGEDTVAGVQVRIYTAAKGTPVVSALKDSMLVLGDSVAVVKGILERQGGNAGDSLAAVRPYREVHSRARAKTTQEPDLCWFAEPLAYAETLRASGKKPRKTGPDPIRGLKQEGFGAVQGMGGIIFLGGKDYEAIHHTAIYAPGPFQNSMRMLRFGTGKDYTPPSWVPAQLAGNAVMYYDVKNGFEHFGSFFDEFYADGDKGTFADIIKQLREDPNGPGIDFPKEVVDRLGERVTVLTDAELPFNHYSTRMVVAVETKDTSGLARAVARMMENDPDVKRRNIGGVTVWQIPQKKKEPKKKAGKPATPAVKPPDHAIAVAHGHLFLADNIKLMEKVLATNGRPLPGQEDFGRVAGALKKWTEGSGCMRYFSRLEEDFRIPYEALRRDQLASTQSMHAQLLYLLIGGAKSKIQGSRLPGFERVSPYLGPSGAVGVTVRDGWFVSGLVLKKHP